MYDVLPDNFERGTTRELARGKNFALTRRILMARSYDDVHFVCNFSDS
jgi:hypothetical protein